MAKIERLGKNVLQIYLPKKEQEKEAPYVVDLIYEGKIVRYVLDSTFLNITHDIEKVSKELFKYLGKKAYDIMNLLSEYEYTSVGFNGYHDYVDITAMKNNADTLETIEELKAKLEPYNCNVISYHTFSHSTTVTFRCK